MADSLADDALYFVPPFAPATGDCRELIKYWEQAIGTQKEIQFGFEILAAVCSWSVAYWWASFLRRSEKKQLQLDGVCVLSLNRDRRCTQFRGWWPKWETTVAARDTHPPARGVVPTRPIRSFENEGSFQAEKNQVISSP